ncbi:MAG TPA: RNA polymerase subunit sigma-24 [Myxococcales bacterium]|nr:RNA polymerase subunit sigma-24 [Deltaproteobacteria bacterium]MBU52471.1 RNA polymerase subunit sigma-24 [Deltaproteobacteria bacterium]HAA54981.1 RNA polymerase subunit sigma-24 [Myxococcales bacterium]|tara:strand:- start:13897 stop:14592 length:696 start_codon:yes stop_codon:yes gene_type:complete
MKAVEAKNGRKKDATMQLVLFDSPKHLLARQGEHNRAQIDDSRQQEVVERSAREEHLVTCEREWIERCKKGDLHALGELYAQHKDLVYNTALRLCREQSDAEDILQEVFIRVAKGIRTFRGDAAFSTWLYRLTINATRTYLKKRASAAREIPVVAEEFVPAREPDPLARDRLLEALSQLPQGYREILVLHDVRGLRHAEIAEILGIQKGTSKSQLSKARNRMRELLKERSI